VTDPRLDDLVRVQRALQAHPDRADVALAELLAEVREEVRAETFEEIAGRCAPACWLRKLVAGPHARGER
jgi:hypothetical protein